ncbi:unnamed protein product, partial [Rotaria sp. Silwood1]
GSFAYHTSTQVCCLGVIKTGNACCGSFAYYTSTQVCCNGVVKTGIVC